MLCDVSPLTHKYLDPSDPKHHRLFALGMHDNIGKVVLKANMHDTTRMVLRYASSLISDTFRVSRSEDGHSDLQKSLKATILDAFQVSLTADSSSTGTKNPRFTTGWIRSKIFLNHALLNSAIDLNETHFGSHFAITVSSLEKLFHKTEWLPVSTI